VVGWALREGRLPLRNTVLLVSGRSSFELVQKAVMAGISTLCSVSAPSSLAVDLAQESGMTLVGFLRDPTMVVYAGAERVIQREV
jgi:FdhD protein